MNQLIREPVDLLTERLRIMAGRLEVFRFRIWLAEKSQFSERIYYVIENVP